MLSFAGCSQPSQGPALGGPASQLGAGFNKMSISSQSTQPGGSGAAQGEKPPVPLFAEGPPVSSQQLPLPPAAHHAPPPLEIPLSQTDFLGTQDFITPVDQFNLDYDPKDAKRSPARLTPNRVKRPRPGASSGGSAGECARLLGQVQVHIFAEGWEARASRPAPCCCTSTRPPADDSRHPPQPLPPAAQPTALPIPQPCLPQMPAWRRRMWAHRAAAARSAARCPAASRVCSRRPATATSFWRATARRRLRRGRHHGQRRST